MTTSRLTIQTDPIPLQTYTESHSILATIARIAQKCFATIKAILTFPLRFLGSKTWSIPGLIYRAVFNKQNLFPGGYHFFIEKALSPSELKPFYPVAAASAYIHRNYSDYIPVGWKGTPDIINDGKTGLKASLIERGDRAILSFGALGSQGDTDFWGKCKEHIRPIKTIVGSQPEAFEQASKLVAKLLKDPLIKNKKLTLTGQCWGGAIASYAALQNQIPAVCFNTFPLGAGLQQAIGPERLSQAETFVTHISSENDPSAGNKFFHSIDAILNRVGIRTSGSFGRRFSIPSIFKDRSKSHTHIFQSIMSYLGENPRAKPAELTIGLTSY